MRFIERDIWSYLNSLTGKYPVFTLTGPRQSGKTTLCRRMFPDLPYNNLEDPEVRGLAQSDPKGFLSDCKKGAIIDEIQRVPELLSYIQVLVDEPGFNGLFLLTGSSNFTLMQSISQSLAGRTAVLTLLPLNIHEAKTVQTSWGTDDLLVSGFYPAIYDRGIEPKRFYSDYISTYVERDLRPLRVVKDLEVFRRFLVLCAGRIGQLLNMEGIGNDLGVSQKTVREWMYILETSYILFLLPPYFRNIGKRLVKRPKLYFYDPALAAFLLGLETPGQLKGHPLRGALFENLVILDVLKYRMNQGGRQDLLFFRDSNGCEVDLIVPSKGRLIPVEIKSAATYCEDFIKGLDLFKKLEPQSGQGTVIYDGNTSGTYKQNQLVPLKAMTTWLSEMLGE